MSRTKQADHRLVQPRPEHYKERTREDGKVESLLCGPYSIEQRQRYFKVMIGLHMTRHPEATYAAAQNAVYHKWRNLVFATIGDEYVPVQPGKQSVDAVKLLKPVKEDGDGKKDSTNQ